MSETLNKTILSFAGVRKGNWKNKTGWIALYISKGITYGLTAEVLFDKVDDVKQEFTYEELSKLDYVLITEQKTILEKPEEKEEPKEVSNDK